MLFPARKAHLVLGQTGPFSFFPRCRVPLKARAAHTYVVGITGQGKSKLLEHMLFQDITQGRGCGLLDPHSDLASDTLRYLATWHDKSCMDRPYLHHRKNLERIIYFDPSRTDFILPFNVLATPFGTYETAQNVVEAFRRTWPQSLAEAPQFSNIALAALITLIENNLSLVEMHHLLTDQDFREALLSNVSNSEVVAFFHDRYDRWGREAPLMRESTLNKVAAFTFNPQLRFILGGRENVLDFRRIMDEGQVLIVDLGRCDPETRRLLGSLIVTGLELAALSRKDIARTEARRPFYFYIDEFQDFCANAGSIKTFSQILSECRKFGLHLTLAHQTLSQLDQRMIGALGNIQLKLVFAVDRNDAEILARKLFSVDGERVKHVVNDEPQQDRTHPVFYTLQEEWEKCIQAIQNLPPRHALVKIQGNGVRRIRTIQVQDRGCSEEQLEGLKRFLAQRAGAPCQLMRQTLEGRDNESKVREEPVFWEPAGL